MFNMGFEELKKIGAEITAREIKQQPDLWQEALENYKKNTEKITVFLNEVISDDKNKVRVIFTGAGTSAYVGDTVLPFLRQNGDKTKYTFESIPTTDIVSSPLEYLDENRPTLLVSFARSGNSPESLAAVQIAKKIVKNLHQITISCAPEGKLAVSARADEKNLLLLMPEKSNDQGFAMTGSFSCMLLTSLLIFDTKDCDKKEAYVKDVIEMGKEVIASEGSIQKIVDMDFSRIVYLGSGALSGLAREAQLKVLELTAGKISTIFDSSMGFRHGPKSFVDDKTMVFVFVNTNPYTRKYDIDILEEINNDKIAVDTVAIDVSGENENFSGTRFTIQKGSTCLPDAYLALPYIIFAQTISLLSSVKVGNTPDTPSKAGTVNRVVKGVTIHEF